MARSSPQVRRVVALWERIINAAVARSGMYRAGTRGQLACSLDMAKEDKGKTAEQIAREMVDRYGADAVPVLHERAEQAKAIGDELAAKIWRDIAGIAELMLQDPCRLLDRAALN
jgi:hypothetical protein